MSDQGAEGSFRGPMYGWWHIEREGDVWQLYGIDDSDNKVIIADIRFNSHELVIPEANANVIRASIAMLEALRGALTIRSSWENTPEGREPLELPWDLMAWAVNMAEGGSMRHPEADPEKNYN